jgi:hypothetical protein
MNPTSLLEQLHDIDGLDPISAWPLAIGWWLLILVGTLLLSAIIAFAAYRIAFLRSWKKDTFIKLDRLERELTEATARETVVALSEYLRRIALRRFSRRECAALVGESWLQWLTTHDPKKFNWEEKGNPLIELPYAPVTVLQASPPELHRIRELIKATRDWVR